MTAASGCVAVGVRVERRGAGADEARLGALEEA